MTAGPAGLRLLHTYCACNHAYCMIILLHPSQSSHRKLAEGHIWAVQQPQEFRGRCISKLSSIGQTLSEAGHCCWREGMGCTSSKNEGEFGALKSCLEPSAKPQACPKLAAGAAAGVTQPRPTPTETCVEVSPSSESRPRNERCVPGSRFSIA